MAPMLELFLMLQIYNRLKLTLSFVSNEVCSDADFLGLCLAMS
jgi:hypothetical protein